MTHFKDLWQEHETRVIEVLLDGLTLLKSDERLARLNTIIRDNEDKRQIEDKINRELIFCLRRANAHLLQRGRGIESDPQYEQRSQPNEAELVPPPADYKRVDIRWGYFDHLAALRSNGQGEKYFCIECKRLGSKIPSGKLSPKYVENGIYRFIGEEHRYGHHTASGAMIGYLEDMTCVDVFDEVNISVNEICHSLNAQTKITSLSSPQVDTKHSAISQMAHQLY